MNRSRFLASASAASAAAVVPRVASASEDVAVTVPAGTLSGTLERPAAAGPVPAVLIIAGSGPTDRDGNSSQLPGKNDSLKLLALGLASRGIASLRYDKRGVGASRIVMPEAELRFGMYVDDAAACLASLRARKEFSRVVIAGHSEGSLIGMLVAAREHADGFVSIAGAGRPAPAVIREQLARQPLPPDLAAAANHILDELAAGRTVDDVPPALAGLFRPSVQPYEISWSAYDPAQQIAKVPGRVAVVQGTADVQTTLGDANALHAGLPSSRLVVVDGMNHVLKHAPDHSTQQAVLAGYTDPTLPVEPAVIDAVAAVARLNFGDSGCSLLVGLSERTKNAMIRWLAGLTPFRGVATPRNPRVKHAADTAAIRHEQSTVHCGPSRNKLLRGRSFGPWPEAEAAPCGISARNRERSKSGCHCPRARF
jgi:hypothetical protein